MGRRHDHIGVIGALAEEVGRLEAHLVDSVVAEHVGRRFHSGTIEGQPVTLVQSRIGKVAAAVTATTLLRDFDVDALIFTGVAGALDDDLGVGDVVVASELIQHDLYGPPGMFARGEVPLLGVIEIPTDAVLTREAAEAARDFVASGFDALTTDRTRRELGIGRPGVHVGQIATGDEFIHGPRRDEVRARAPEALCVDMEGAAVAQVCVEHGGVPLCAIRAISDLASGTAAVDFPRFLDVLAQHYSYEILRRMFAAE